MKVTVSGATGVIGTALVRALLARGDEVTVLSRDPERARGLLGDVDAAAWSPADTPAPAQALSGRDGVVHLAGEAPGQRWTEEAKRRILASRVDGTGNLVAGLRAADPRPAVLVSASGTGYYGAHGDDVVDEATPPGDDFLARVCVAWEGAAGPARELGMRVVTARTGVVLDRDTGALQKMLPFFKAGVGGPVAGGRQYMPWIHLDDVVGIYLAALDDSAYDGPVNVTAPDPVTNAVFSKALGRALGRPAVLPVPAFVLKVLYGEMAGVVLTGQRAVPSVAEANGYRFRHRDLDAALRAALGRG